MFMLSASTNDFTNIVKIKKYRKVIHLKRKNTTCIKIAGFNLDRNYRKIVKSTKNMRIYLC